MSVAIKYKMRIAFFFFLKGFENISSQGINLIEALGCTHRVSPLDLTVLRTGS